MSDIIDVNDEPSGWDTERLRRELAQGLTLTAVVLTRLGKIWAELERRGEDLSQLRHGLARVLPLIASGLLAAEAVVAFAGRPAILRALEGLPLEEQRGIADGAPIEVALAIGSQKTEHVPITAIPANRLRVVFQDGLILSPAEQRVRLGRKKRSSDSEEQQRRHYLPYYDRDKGTVTIGRLTIQLVDLLRQLSAVAGPDNVLSGPPEEYVTVKTRLTQEEMARLLTTSKQAELPEWELIRKALRAFGLI